MNPNGNISSLKPFEKGRSGNPSGRPKGIHRRVRELYSEDEMIAGMVATARGEAFPMTYLTDPDLEKRDILDARKWLSEYGWGKAPSYQPIEAGDVLERDELDAEILAIAESLRAERAA